ncbi:MAG: hypothetical protein L6Q95_17175 [Planctomycetes bacterium]|nr:hypothetical protein [Planctomycetota bacterium]
MTEFRDGRPSADARLRVETGAEIPPAVRRKLVDEVRRRLANGELDTDLARVETAFALLDGDLRSGR